MIWCDVCLCMTDDPCRSMYDAQMCDLFYNGIEDDLIDYDWFEDDEEED